MSIPWAILGQLALQAGQSYLGSKAQQAEQRAMNRARERQRVAQEKENNRVNLMNAFGGNASAAQIPVTYKGSDRANTLRSLGQVAGLGSQAIGLYSGMKEAETARKAAEETRKLQNTAAQMTIDRQLGETAGQAAPLPTDPATFGAALQMLPQSDPRLLQTLGKTQTQIPEDLSKYGRSVFDATMNQRQLDAASRAREDLLYGQQQRLNEARIRDLEAQAAALGKKNLPTFQSLITTNEKLGQSYAASNPHMSNEDLFVTPEYKKALAADPSGRVAQSFIAGYRDKAPEVRIQLREIDDKALNQVYGDVSKQKLITQRGDFTRAITEMVQGDMSDSGFGDLGMLKALAKVQDPGSAVLTEEFKSLADAQGWFQNRGVILKGLIDGDRLTSAGRQKVLELGFASFEARRREIDSFIDNMVKARKERFPNLDFKSYLDPLRLNAKENYIDNSIFDEIKIKYAGDNPIRLNLWEPVKVVEEMNDMEVLDRVKNSLNEPFTPLFSFPSRR